MRNSNYIHRSEKEQKLHPATVRSILKKAGFTVGSWGANGRIKGMSNFFGGDLEVKENYVSSRSETKKHWSDESKFVVTDITVVNVEVNNWGDVDMGKVEKVLQDNGLVTKLVKSNHLTYLIVDKK